MKAATTGLIAAAVLAGPAKGQQPTDTVPPDSVIQLGELTVPVGRLRVGAIPVANAPFPVHTIRRGGGFSQGLTKQFAAVPGVTFGNQTGSPYQADLRIRGFAVSPVVGLPQSVSVFVDGVRVNEADASQVHLSLVPAAAVERLELVRGPVGAFGRNSLAGSINIVTARGTETSGVSFEGEGGSYRSGSGIVRAGGQSGAVDGLITGAYRRSEGWRQLGHSDELSLFGKVGWRGGQTDAWISYTLEADSLEGPGPLPESWIEGHGLPTDIVSPPSDPRRLQYTGGNGDAFKARMHFVNSRLERDLTSNLSLQLTSFARFVDFRQSNDNLTEPDALGITDIASYGATVQLARQPHAGLIIVGGIEAVRNEVDIDIRERPNRAFPSVVPRTTERLRTHEKNLAGFGEAFWHLRPNLALHTSLRFDYTSLPVEDLIDPADSGHNTFAELTGGLGLSSDVGGGLRAFAGYSRGFRAPVILEVSCADPSDPCQLPFELGPDPPLEPVKSDSWQAGLRLSHDRLRVEWVAYWSEVGDDIFNVIDLATPTRGYFTNLDRTRRIGSELAVQATPFPGLSGLSVAANIGLTRATFQSAAVLAAPFIDDDDDPSDPPVPGEVELESPEVEPGDRFPMVPALSLALGAGYTFGHTSIRLDANMTGEQFLVGDENNEAPFDNLELYTVFDLSMEQQLGRAWAYLEVGNLFDARYSLFGIISRNLRDPDEEVERFLTPGLPRSLKVGFRVGTGG